MVRSSKPTGTTVRAYQVGFGDCFLLTVHYPARDRHVLIDFGTTGTPDGRDKERLLAIATDIATRSRGRLDAIVATHRHKDHIAGFDTAGIESPGAIIRSLKPRLVVQPWTEDPKARTNARAGVQKRVKNFRAALGDMQTFAGHARSEAISLARYAKGAAAPLGFLGEANLANRAAVENLMRMAPNDYVFAGGPTRLTRVLPGVKVWVLGPPTLLQAEGIKRQRRSDPNEFWQLQADYWRLLAGHVRESSRPGLLFPARHAVLGRVPVDARWFVRHAAAARAEELLGLVRSLDTALNNTSVILVFEVNGKRLLFPGDAQIENWEYALGQPKNKQILKNVQLYKVGHHGSRNATPKSLWRLFETRSTTASRGRLTTILSTMGGKHGHEDDHTEVPRKALVQALRRESAYFTTQELGSVPFAANAQVDD